MSGDDSSGRRGVVLEIGVLRSARDVADTVIERLSRLAKAVNYGTEVRVFHRIDVPTMKIFKALGLYAIISPMLYTTRVLRDPAADAS